MITIDSRHDGRALPFKMLDTILTLADNRARRLTRISPSNLLRRARDSAVRSGLIWRLMLQKRVNFCVRIVRRWQAIGFCVQLQRVGADDCVALHRPLIDRHRPPIWSSAACPKH